ncbi:MAG: phage tail protein [Gammaproteobacteria bacterium]
MSSQKSILLRHLPEIYHDSDDLRAVLSAFDRVLFGFDGTDSGSPPGLEQKIARIPALFDPKPGQVGAGNRTPTEFLIWLADWVALEGIQAMPEEQLRHLIARIVPLYAIRGTRQYLIEILSLFFPEIAATVSDQSLPSLKIGESRVGIGTRLGGDIPFLFYVRIRIPKPMHATDIDGLKKRIGEVIDSAKPAHTFYRLECVFEDRDRQDEGFFDADG